VHVGLHVRGGELAFPVEGDPAVGDLELAAEPAQMVEERRDVFLPGADHLDPAVGGDRRGGE
jgi:hypothetical protein